MTEKVLAWGLLGGCLWGLFGDAWSWAVLAAVPWLIGGALIVWMPDGRFEEAVALLQETPLARVALLLILVLTSFAAWLFGAPGGVLALTIVAVIGLAALRRGGARRATELMTGIVTTGVTLLLLGVAAEVVLSRPSIGAVWGSPRELASWETRYDRLATQGNLLGFRSPYEQIRKPPGTYRVVAIGDSYTWGSRVPQTEDTWPAVLQSILEGRVTTRDVQVVNLARNGFTTANEVELMRRLGWQFDPDVVLLQFFVNDAFPSWADLGRAGSADVFGRYRLLPGRFQGAAAGSAVVAFMEIRLNSLLREADYGSLYEEGAEGWGQLRASIEELGREAEERGVPVVMLMLPRFPQGSWDAETHPHRDIHSRVAGVATESGLRVLDMMPVFGAVDRPGAEWWATPYDVHPNGEAHAVIAHEAARVLEEGELLPGA